MKLFAFALGTFVIPLLALADLTPGKPTVGPGKELATTKPTTKPSTSPTRFEKEIKAFEAADLKNPPPQGGIVFTGSSTIRRWTTLQKDFPDLPVINRGFGGSWLRDATYFADRIIVPYKPRVVVLYAGGNDMNANRTPELVYADFKEFVAKLRSRLPDVRIIYMGNGPSPKRWAQADNQKRANVLIRQYIEAGANMDYVEIWDQLLGPDGKPREDLYAFDKLHNSAAGYKIRTEILGAHLRGTPATGG